MEYRLLGASGLEVSVLSFGTMTLGGEGRFAAMGRVQAEEALGARRNDIVLATKVFVRLEPGANKSGLSRGHILEACEASLRRLGTDYIDLYQAHNFDSLTPLDETMQFGLLSGKFRRRQTKPAEPRLNSLDAPGVVDEERLYRIVDTLAEVAALRGVSISQAALNWVMRKPGVDTVIVGARNEQQLRDNLAAANWTLTEAEVARLDEVSALPLPYPYWHRQKFAGDRNPPPKHVR